MFSFKSKKGWAISLGAGALLSSLIMSTVQAQLLGVAPTEPFFRYNSGGTAAFDAMTGTVAINATPLEFTPMGGTAVTIYPLGTAPSVIASISLDTSCGLVGGDPDGDDLSVSGDIDLNSDFVPEHTGVLLTGEVIGFGVDGTPVPTAALFDARFVVTGGALVDSGDYPIGSEVGLTLTVEANNFTGDCAVDWIGGATGTIGAVETIEESRVETCYGVEKVSIRDGGGKIKVGIATGCPDAFDPAQELVELRLDGETFSFSPGSFNRIGTSNKYRAGRIGTPATHAVLNCDEGTFRFSALQADVSQIDNSGGVDITLLLGGTLPAAENVVLNETGYWREDPKKMLFYNNPDAANCGISDAKATNHHEVKCRHIPSGKIFTFSQSRYNLAQSIFVHDATTGHSAVFDTSMTSILSCGDQDADGNWEIVGISHKDGSKDCTTLTEEEEDNDKEDNAHD
ncbi:MAG: hypothetical protein V3T17_15120 [Pseudomonadales bacterium]